jgi:DNA helicase II / ATP-dependent DNA helicase PcrA
LPEATLVDTPKTGALAGPLRILAGPGTGKTHALVTRYADLVEGGHAARGQILVLTFSTSAAAEIAQRIDERLADSYDQAWVSTFHSFCWRLLREHRPDPRRLLLSGFQEWVAMRRVLAEMDADRLGSLDKVRGHDVFAQDLLAFVALLKQNLVHPAAFALAAEATGSDRLRALGAAYSAYQARLQNAHLVDFRDLVWDVIQLLDASEQSLDRLRRRFTHVLVDEFQDVDPAQFALLKRIAPPEGRPNLVVVGDPDQSIYGFRGTQPRLLVEDFPRIYQPLSGELGVSRRCAPDVLEAGERLLRATQSDRPRRELASTAATGTSPITVVEEANGVDEAFFVAREIKGLLLASGGTLRPGDVAILLRSTTSLSAPFEEALRALGLEYEVRGLGAMARNEVVRFLLAYLAALERPDDSEALERVLAASLSGVSARLLGRLRAHGLEEGRPLVKVVRRLMYHLASQDPAAYPLPWGGEPPAETSTPPDYVEFSTADELRSLHRALAAFYTLRAQSERLPLRALAYLVLIEAGVLERLLGLGLSESERLEALADLRAALDGFAELEEVAERLDGERPRLGSLPGRLEALVARAVDESQPAAAAKDAVQILTVHQSKGLEFEVVFCSGFAHGIFPLPDRAHPLLDEQDRAWLETRLEGFRPSWPADQQGHLAEEARLAYVAMTRARRRLYVTYAGEYLGAAGPSPFLELAAPKARVLHMTRSGHALEPATVLTMSEAETLLNAARETIAAPQAELLRGLGVDVDFVLDPRSGTPFLPYDGALVVGVDPGHFSATALNNYLKCPRFYFYNDHPGLAQQPRGIEMTRGGFLHEVLEEFHRREEEWRSQPPEAQRQWLEAVLAEQLERYLARVESVLDRKREEQEVRRILENYIVFATSSQPIRREGTLAVEKKFRLNLDSAEIRGKIDRINDTGAGTCEVVDYKTGRGYTLGRAYDSYFGPEMHDVQLALYYLACLQGVDEEGAPIALEPRFLSVWYPKERRPYDHIRQVLFAVGEPAPGVSQWTQRALDGEDLSRSREVVRRAIERIRAGDFRPAPKPVAGTCLSWFGCAFSAVCPYGGTPPEE